MESPFYTIVLLPPVNGNFDSLENHLFENTLCLVPDSFKNCVDTIIPI